MARRGQNNEAWLARWRDGACPVHGGGMIDDVEAGRVRCSNDECAVRAVRFPGPDAHHASFGWVAGPDDVRALLAKAGDIAPEGSEPGPRARVVRISYALE